MSFYQLGIIGKTGFGKSLLCRNLIDDFSRVIVIDPHDQFKDESLFSSYDIEDFILKIGGKTNFRIKCTFASPEDEYNLFKICWNLQNYLLVIDEISLYADSYNINDYLNEIITRGRLRNISLLWNTQRPALISRTLTSQAWGLISFRLNDIADLKHISLPKADKEEILSLEKFNFKIVYGSANEMESFFHCKKIEKVLDKYK